MLTETGFTPQGRNARESRVYGYEVKYGPKDLEATLARSDGRKDVEILVGPERVGNAFMQATKRVNTGRQTRLLVSVWLSYPFVLNDTSDLAASLQAKRPEFLRAHRVLRRLIRRKVSKFFEDQRHG